MRKMPGPGVDVLFASYGGGHVTALYPVAKSLTEEGITTGFLGLTTAQAFLENRGMDYFGYAELEGADDPQVQTWGKEFAGPEDKSSPVPYRETVAYHGLNFRDLVFALGEAVARDHYDLNGRQGFSPVATMEALLRRLNPKILVATNSPRSERALFLAARNLGIPAICIVDLFAIQEIKWIAEPGYASVICVLNDQVASYFVEQGCEAQTVVVTGNPAFDTLVTPEVQAAGVALRRARGFAESNKVILWASNVEPERHPFTGASGDPELPRRIEAELREIVARHQDWRLVVRYHPSETVGFSSAVNVQLSTREENLHALINAVDVVVVMGSTVGLEAHLAGRPVISVDMSVFTHDAPYSKMGVSTGVAALNQLEAVIEAAPGVRTRADSNDASVGTATKAVLDQIFSLLQ